MHGVPAVSFPVGLPVVVTRVAMFLWLAGAACSVSTIAAISAGRVDGDPWRSMALIGACVVSGILCMRSLRRAPSGLLAFDGARWRFGGVEGVVLACVDLQWLMLVRFSAGSRQRRWLWVRKEASVASWLSLRRAVYSRAPKALDASEPGSSPESGNPSSFSR